MGRPTVVAIDVGGTTIKGALVDAAGHESGLRVVATPAGDGDAVVAEILRTARELADAGTVAVGVVVPGVVDVAAGIARHAANIGWRDVPLRDLLAAELALPVVVDHDVRAAGLAERSLGRAREQRNCLVVVIGTGIAAVVVADGAPIRGATGTAGELGHVPVQPGGERCRCGQLGCLEAYASAASIARRYAAACARAGREAAGATARDVVAARGSDPQAAAVWDRATGALGIALAGYTLLLDPALIVLGGGLAAAGDALLEPVRDELARRLAWRPAPRVELSSLGPGAGRAGAALLAWETAPAR